MVLIVRIAQSFQRLPSLSVLSVLSLLSLVASCAACVSFDRPGEASFDEGVRAYRAARYDAAAAAFTTAARAMTRETDRARALHNLGNALARAGRDREALNAYRASLRLGDREATRLNHELVRARLPRQRQPPPGREARDQRMFESARALARPVTESGPSSRRRDHDW